MPVIDDRTLPTGETEFTFADGSIMHVKQQHHMPGAPWLASYAGRSMAQTRPMDSTVRQGLRIYHAPDMGALTIGTNVLDVSLVGLLLRLAPANAIKIRPEHPWVWVDYAG